MRIRYSIPFKRKIIIDDHWEIPLQGGKLQIIEEAGYAKAIELTFEKQPLEYAPQTQRSTKGEVVATISSRNPVMLFMKRQLDDAATFLECLYDRASDQYQYAWHEGEAPISLHGCSALSPSIPTQSASISSTRGGMLSSGK